METGIEFRLSATLPNRAESWRSGVNR